MKNSSKVMTSGILTYAAIAACNAQAAVSKWGDSVAPEAVPTDIEGAIMNVTNYILGFIAIIATLMVIFGGLQYLTAAGNDDQVGKAKKTMVNGIIGLVICGLAYAMVKVVSTVILAN